MAKNRGDEVGWEKGTGERETWELRLDSNVPLLSLYKRDYTLGVFKKTEHEYSFDNRRNYLKKTIESIMLIDGRKLSYLKKDRKEKYIMEKRTK